MRAKIFIILFLMLATDLLAKEAPMTNRVNWQWFTMDMNYKYSNTFYTNNEFYKFIIITPGYDLNVPYPMPGDTIHIPVTIQNVGSIDETNGISLSAYFDTNIGTITLTSNTNNPISFISNISSLTSGEFMYYWANIVIKSNASEGSYTFFITNKSLSANFPLTVIYSNAINVYMQSVTVYSAYDGIHTIKTFDGTGRLGNLDITIDMSFYRTPIEAYLYYDIGADPDGSTPDGTINKNRRVRISKSGNLWKATIPVTDPEIEEGKQMRFIITADGKKFYYSGTIPYSYYIKYYAVQKVEGEEPVIVLDNVGNFTEKPVKIIWTLYRSSYVNITVYNLRGEVIRILKNQTMPIGRHKEIWDGKNDYGNEVSPGIYFIYVNTFDYGVIRKILFVKEE